MLTLMHWYLLRLRRLYLLKSTHWLRPIQMLTYLHLLTPMCLHLSMLTHSLMLKPRRLLMR
ncbi:TPA: hypothetical protein ACHGXI_002137, partial [Streptococcus pneumoniae]